MQIQIKGMHCGACEKLIKMELEDAGLADLVKNFSEPKDNHGALTLSDTASAEQIEQVKDVINKMDDYSVVS